MYFINKVIRFSVISFIIWLAPQVGKINQIWCWDWLPEQARWHYLACLGVLADCPARQKSTQSNNNHLLAKQEVKMAGYWPYSFFANLTI